jgi:hypothetical protein
MLMRWRGYSLGCLPTQRPPPPAPLPTRDLSIPCRQGIAKRSYVGCELKCTLRVPLLTGTNRFVRACVWLYARGGGGSRTSANLRQLACVQGGVNTDSGAVAPPVMFEGCEELQLQPSELLFNTLTECRVVRGGCFVLWLCQLS